MKRLDLVTRCFDARCRRCRHGEVGAHFGERVDDADGRRGDGRTKRAHRRGRLATERERAALRWAELVTNTPHSDASDEEFARLRQHFSDEEIAELSFVIVTINSWNLLNVSLRNPVPLKAPYVAAA